MDRPAVSEVLPADLLAALVWTVGAVAVATLPAVGGSSLRALVGGSFLLFVPGYVLAAVVFPRAGAVTLPERLTLAVGASFALGALVGVPLTWLPGGLDLGSVLVGEALLVAVLAAMAVLARRSVPAGARARPAGHLRRVAASAWASRNRIGGGSRLLRALLVVAVLASTGAVAYTAATPLPSERYTEFYVLGPEGTAAGLPDTVSTGEPVAFAVGIRNHEHRPTSYSVRVRLDRADGPPAVERTLREVRLDHRGEWRRTLSLPVASPPVDLELLLFVGDPPPGPADPSEAYRYVRVPLGGR